MATKRNSTTAPPDGFQTFTITLSDADVALLLLETQEQEAYHRAWSTKNGFPIRTWSPDKMAGVLVSLALDASNARRKLITETAARQPEGTQAQIAAYRQEGGAQ